MQRVFVSLLTALAVTVLPRFLAAEETERPERPRPERPSPTKMFDRLDANHDGAITADEIPEGAERLKKMLIRADENQDKKLTKDECTKFFKALHAKRQAEGRSMPGQKSAHHGHKGQRPPMHDAKTIFKHLDKDGNGSLSLEEFSIGMRRFYKKHKHHDGTQMDKGYKHPGKKPEMKKAECKKPAGKAAKASAKKGVEARLAALEKQQAEILSLLRKLKADK